MIDCVVAPFDQRFPVALLEVKITLSGVQKVVGPLAVTVGPAGVGFTVTVIAFEGAEVQFPSFTTNEKVPDASTVIDCVVAPFDQILPVALLEVKITLSGVQNVVGPLAVTVGPAGVGLTVTVIAFEGAETQLPSSTTTEKVPDANTVIDWVVAPFDQIFPVALLEVNITLSGVQNVVGPLAVTVGPAGVGLTVTVIAFEGAELQLPSLTTTEKVPDANTVIDCVVAPFDQILPVALLEVNITLSPVQKVVGPLAVTVGVAGSGLTVTTIGTEKEEQPKIFVRLTT